MQNYKTVKDTDSIQSSREIFNNAITSAVSNNSGTAFPTDNLVVGMKCYRSDLGKTYTLTDVTNKTWKEDSKADSADKATKLATARTITLSGKATGSASFDGSANASINVTAVTADSCSGNSATASEVAWTGITGKPSTYTPATHNHDTSYPSTSGSRATGTWGISVTGSAGSVAWDNVTGKPSTYTPASHTHSYLPLSGGTITGKVNIQSATLENMPQIKRTDGDNFAGIRCENTNGYLGAIGIRGAKNSPIVRVDTSGTSYPVLDSSNYNSYSPTKTGTGATGTWGISISGNAATATTANAVEWGNVTGKPSTYTPATHTHSYLPLSGGTLSNPSNTNGNVEIHRDVSSGSLGISGGSEVGKGATLYLCGEDSGRFTLRVSNTSSIKLLTAEPSGTLMWGGDDLNGAAIKFKSLSTSVGIIWYKSGLIFQWGQKTLTAGTTSYTVNLPLTATKNHNIQITTTTNIVPRIADITNSSFNVTFNSSPTSSDVMHWLVIGYLNY